MESSIVLLTMYVVPRLDATVMNSNGRDDCKYLLTWPLSMLDQWFEHERGDPVEIIPLSTEGFT